jgi:transcriptional regulator with XRE-family HTH domain
VARDVKASFGRRLRSLRVEAEFSQEDFAGAAGVHRTYVGAIERGERSVSLVNLAKIAVALGISLSELFEGVR